MLNSVCPTCGQEGTVKSVQSLDFTQKLSEVVENQVNPPTQGCLMGMWIIGVIIGGILSFILVPDLAWNGDESDGGMMLYLIIIFPAAIFAVIWFYLYRKAKSKNLSYITSMIQSSNIGSDMLYCKHCNGVFKTNDMRVTPIKESAQLFNLQSN